MRNKWRDSATATNFDERKCHFKKNIFLNKKFSTYTLYNKTDCIELLLFIRCLYKYLRLGLYKIIKKAIVAYSFFANLGLLHTYIDFSTTAI